MTSKDVVSPLCHNDVVGVLIWSFWMMVSKGYIALFWLWWSIVGVGVNRDTWYSLGFVVSLIVGTVDWTLVLSLPRIDWRVIIAAANFCWLLKTGDGVGGDLREANRSNMTKDNVLVAVIVGSAHVIGEKSTVFGACELGPPTPL